MLRQGGWYVAVLERGIGDELLDDGVVSFLLEKSALACAGELHGSIFRRNHEHRAAVAGFQAVAHDQSFEHRRILFALVAHLDLDECSWIEEARVADQKLPRRRIAVDQSQLCLRNTVALPANVDGDEAIRQ